MHFAVHALFVSSQSSLCVTGQDQVPCIRSHHCCFIAVQIYIFLFCVTTAAVFIHRCINRLAAGPSLFEFNLVLYAMDWDVQILI